MNLIAAADQPLVWRIVFFIVVLVVTSGITVFTIVRSKRPRRPARCVVRRARSTRRKWAAFVNTFGNRRAGSPGDARNRPDRRSGAQHGNVDGHVVPAPAPFDRHRAAEQGDALGDAAQAVRLRLGAVVADADAVVGDAQSSAPSSSHSARRLRMPARSA
jgi:hypothetical protein